MRTRTASYGVATAAASAGLLATGAAAPAFAQDQQHSRSEQPERQIQSAQNQGDQLTKRELRSLVIDVVDKRVRATGETQVTVKQLTDSVVTVDTTVVLNDNVQDERGLESELRKAVDQAIQDRVDQGTEVQVNVDVRDDDNGNNGGTAPRDDTDQIKKVPEGSVATGGHPDSDVMEYVIGGAALAAATGVGAAATRRLRREDG